MSTSAHTGKQRFYFCEHPSVKQELTEGRAWIKSFPLIMMEFLKKKKN